MINWNLCRNDKQWWTGPHTSSPLRGSECHFLYPPCRAGEHLHVMCCVLAHEVGSLLSNSHLSLFKHHILSISRLTVNWASQRKCSSMKALNISEASQRWHSITCKIWGVSHYFSMSEHLNYLLLSNRKCFCDLFFRHFFRDRPAHRLPHKARLSTSCKPLLFLSKVSYTKKK